MSNDEDSPGESLEERTQHHYSNLRRLIEGITELLATSSDLLARLQRVLGQSPLASTDADASNPSDTRAPTESGE